MHQKMKRYNSLKMALLSNSTFLTLKRDWEESSWGKAAKSSMKHQPEHGGIQRRDRAVTPRLPQLTVGLSQPQVNYSLDTMSTLAFTTLITIDK
jgi:hypothetical protein